MSANSSPITPSVLEWCLAQDARPRSEIARALGIEPALLDAWVAGDEKPTVGQVTDLADTLKRPRAFFFLPRPPEGAALPNGFRHPPGAGDRTVSPQLLLHARRSKRLQQAIAAAVPDDQLPAVPRASIDKPPERAAARAREWLRVGAEERWPSEYAALARWRQALDDAGVLVFALQMGSDQVRGFAYWDERAPMIVSNTSAVSPAARIFTLGHELGHLLLREATACLEPRGGRLSIDTRTERWCERFAAALLMPRTSVVELMRKNGVGQGEADINTVRDVMNAFRVSARAAALRLIDLEYAEQSLYAAVLAVFQVSKTKKASTPRSPKRHIKRLREYGPHTVSTVMTTLPPRDALSVLRITVEDARRLADEVPGVPAL